MPKKPASPTTVNPPEGWKDGDGDGFMYGHDAQGESVDLVRLADLVRWLQFTRKLTFSNAVQAVIDAVPDDVMGWLYGLRKSDSALLLPKDCLFGLHAPAVPFFGKVGRRISGFGFEFDCEEAARRQLELDRKAQPYIEARRAWHQEPGRPALLRYLEAVGRAKPGVLENKDEIVYWVGIPRAKAFELWGWGTVDSVAVDATATSLQPVEAPSSANIDPPVAKPKAKEKVSLDWDSEETKDAFLAAFEAAPGGSNAKKLKYLASSGEWGVGDQRLKQRLQEIRDERGASKTQLPKVANSVFGLGNS